MDHPTHPPAILVVDDDPSALAVLTHYMRKLAPTHAIVTAEDGQRALAHLETRPIQLLLSDYLLPDMDGLQLIAAVKTASPQTYVVLTSADDTPAFQQQARDQGVDMFLAKQDLLARLEDVVRSVLSVDDAD